MRKAAEGCRLRRAAAGLAAALLTAGLVVVAAGCRSAAPNESGGGTAITRPSQALPDVLDETSEGTPEDAVQTPDGSAPPDSPATQAENQGADAPEDGAAETVPEDQAVKLELYRRQPEDNEKFTARDLLPGDSLTRYFAVRAYHDQDIELLFEADITEEEKALGDVLQVRVTDADSGRVLCEGTFSEIDGQAFARTLTANADGQSTAYYRVDAWLDTSVGNEYQAARLLADLRWYVEGGGLTPPQTGVAAQVGLWAAVGAAALLVLFLVLLIARRRKEARHGQAD